MLDTYGYRVTTKRRHKDCDCKVPCEKRFRCSGSEHKGRRATPYCCGAYDDAIDLCDACWVIKNKAS